MANLAVVWKGMGANEPTPDWKGPPQAGCASNGAGRAPRNPGKPVLQRHGFPVLALRRMGKLEFASRKIEESVFALSPLFPKITW